MMASSDSQSSSNIEGERDMPIRETQPTKWELIQNWAIFANAKRTTIWCIVLFFGLAFFIITIAAIASGPFKHPKTPQNVPILNPLILSSDPNSRAVQLLQLYLSINTAPPVLDFAQATKFLIEVAEYFKFEVSSLEITPGRPILIYKIAGLNPTLKSIVVMSHMDVVPVVESLWKYPPFGGYLNTTTGNIYGRGAQDEKSVAVQAIEAMVRTAGSGKKFQRNVYMVFVADEETNTTLASKDLYNTPEWSSMNVGVILDEGGPSPNSILSVYYGQRTVWRPTIYCMGNSGHGSLIIKDTAVSVLSQILQQSLVFRSQQENLMMNQNLTLGYVTTLNPTVLQAGVLINGTYAVNVIPPSAFIQFDIRIARGDVPLLNDLFVNLTNQNYGDAHATFSPHVPEESAVTPLVNNPWWTAFQVGCQNANINIVPDIFPAGAYGDFARNLGISVFGFSPLYNTTILLHDNDEYVNENVFLNGIDIFIHIITSLGNTTFV